MWQRQERWRPKKAAPDRQGEENVVATPHGEPVAAAGPPEVTPDVSPQDATANMEHVAVATVPPPSVLSPSADQIARWNLPQSAKLELLGCADGFRDTFVCCLDVSPDGQQLLVGGQRLTLWSLTGSEPE